MKNISIHKHVFSVFMVIGILTYGLASFWPTAALPISNGMSANHVLGQSDFTSSGYGATLNTMKSPTDVVYDYVRQRAFVVEEYNNRVLIFDLIDGIVDGMDADYVLGQPDFSSSTANWNGVIAYDQGPVQKFAELVSPKIAHAASVSATQYGFSNPTSLAFDETLNRLFVGDTGNNRVLMFDLSSGVTNGMPATNVLGQPDFGSRVSTTSQSGLSGPRGLAYNNDEVYPALTVADTGNNRVLIFIVSSGVTNGMPAGRVLGQPDFLSSSEATTQSGMRYPSDVAFEIINTASSRLFVSDTDNNRVLVFNFTGPFDNGLPASNVLGQDDFISNTQNQGQLLASSDSLANKVTSLFKTKTAHAIGTTPDENSLAYPVGLTFDDASKRLFVADSNNRRVLVFDLLSGVTDAMDASHVIGQSDFVSDGAPIAHKHTILQRFASFFGPNIVYAAPAPDLTALNFSGVAGLHYDSLNNLLFVSDSRGNRVLIFDLSEITSSGFPPTPTCVLTASSNLIQPGGQVVLTYTAEGQGAESAYYTQLQNDLTNRNKSTKTIEVSPVETTEYTLAIVNARGANYCSATIVVEGAPVAVPETDVAEEETVEDDMADSVGQGDTEEKVEEPETPKICEPYLLEYIHIKRDNNPSEVIKLEAFLNVFENLDLPINGIYEQKDFDAVVHFQEKYQTGVLGPWNRVWGTGYVYKTTTAQINKMYCEDFYSQR